MRSRHITKTSRLENLFLTELVSDITYQRFLCSLCHIFSKFIIIFQLVLRRIYRVALEIAGEKLYISQLPGLRYKKNSLTSTGHAGNLPYANKTNKLRKIDYISVKANIIRGSFTQQRRLPKSKSQLIVQFA